MGGIRNILALGLLFSTGVVYAGDPVNDYARAQKCYYQLDKSSVRGWSQCQSKFSDLIEQYPKSSQAKKSLFNLGRLAEERHEKFSQIEDLEFAIKKYNEFLRQFPDDPLADDCLFRIAELRRKNGEKEKADRALQAMLERYPNGDMAAKVGATEPSQAIINLIESPKPPAPVFLAPTAPVVANPIKTIVIDPGHGGSDTGAKGPKGTKEAVVSLQIARKLAAELKKDLGVKVLLTRTSNRELSLDERNQFANQHQADLFISVHANASTIRKARGVQTFYLNNATSEASSRLATAENKVIGKPLDLSSRILSTMLQNANTDESRVFAQTVQGSLVGSLSEYYSGVEDLKVATALFYVLVGVKAPSILVETSFISNPTEELRLNDTGYQWAVAKGITAGVKKYLAGQKQTASSL